MHTLSSLHSVINLELGSSAVSQDCKTFRGHSYQLVPTQLLWFLISVRIIILMAVGLNQTQSNTRGAVFETNLLPRSSQIFLSTFS